MFICIIKPSGDRKVRRDSYLSLREQPRPVFEERVYGSPVVPEGLKAQLQAAELEVLPLKGYVSVHIVIKEALFCNLYVQLYFL